MNTASFHEILQVVSIMIILTLVLVVIHLSQTQEYAPQSSRSLVISNGGIIKLIVGMAMPIELPVSMVWIQNLQFQYGMIDNAVQLSYLNLLRNSKSLSLTRNSVYKILAQLWDQYGMNGTACVLRVICEVNKYSYTHNGILGTLLDTTFTPHKQTDQIYKNAMELGKSGEYCEKYFSVCKTNILDFFHTNMTEWNN